MTTDQVTAAVERFTSAKPAMRTALWESAIAIALRAADERDALEQKMEAQWRWLDRNEQHPKRQERESDLIENIQQYEQMEDSLRIARDTLLASAA